MRDLNGYPRVQAYWRSLSHCYCEEFANYINQQPYTTRSPSDLLWSNLTERSNQSMKPTAPLRGDFRVFATTPSTSSRFPASLVRFACSRSPTPAVLLFNDCRGLSLSR